MKKLLTIFLAALMLAGCSGKDDPSINDAPKKPVLLFPDQNAVCTQGTILSATQTSVVFKWQKSENADSYDVIYKNLLTTASATQTVTDAQAAITLQANTPYAWYVVAKSSSVAFTAKSDSWKFYNAGQATVNYAPFPADLVSPSMLSTITTTKVTFQWTGSDADGDPLTYDLYCGTVNTTMPPLVKAGLTNGSYADFAIQAGNTYYWKIITKDGKGNESDSGLSSFTVK